jgi:hypothetical protein
VLGDLNYDEINDVVQTVQPNDLIPVDTQHPEVFRNFHNNVIFPEKGINHTLLHTTADRLECALISSRC